MRDQHPPYWECPMCAASHVSFNEEDAFIRHIEGTHASTVSDDMISSLVLGCTVISIGVTRCPLCDSTGSDTDPVFIQHVLSCIHDFSLASLPWSRETRMHVSRLEAVGAFNLESEQSRSCILPWLQGITEPKQMGQIERNVQKHEIKSTTGGSDVELHDMHEWSMRDEEIPFSVYFDVKAEDSVSNATRSSRTDGDESADHDLPIYTSSVPLEIQMWRVSVKHANHGICPSFWPPPVWKALVTETSIFDTLLELDDIYDENTALTLAREIVESGPRRGVTVFTILVLIDKLDSVNHILRDCKYGGIRDEMLPLVLRLNDWGDSELFHRNGDKVAECCLYRWRAVHLEAFNNFQRRLSPTIFGLKQCEDTLIHLDLEDDAILPWCELQENVIPVPAMSGGFGTVSRVKIHPMCHTFHDTLKEVSGPDRQLFLILFRLSTLERTSILNRC